MLLHITLPTERDHTDVRKIIRKMLQSLQRDRYGLSERAKLILGMSHDTKTIFGKIFPGGLFLGPINSLA